MKEEDDFFLDLQSGKAKLPDNKDSLVIANINYID
ncbi:hypothetical protein Spica_0105 [Gracilinema caldarium DSM 7334]|uniref:Uncharacterized protein n=1 Tax=Gracilinema caldarium (strain ATCC 51460 / DSM 7334 / H1) TaxID=744872 RepID=F8EYB5_GRAC1|nr:hypothetical protein Spica_0105 [Gracilinema caldarium DSM 7334]